MVIDSLLIARILVVCTIGYGCYMVLLVNKALENLKKSFKTYEVFEDYLPYFLISLGESMVVSFV